MFCHSLFGIHHYTSRNGTTWSRKVKPVVHGALRAFIFHQPEKKRYYLYYEKLRSIFPYHSELEMKTSIDLIHWSDAQVIVKPEYKWNSEGLKKGAIGNPCLVKVDKEYRLYFSSGQVYLEDCKFGEPINIGVALGTSPEGPFTMKEEPILFTEKRDKWANKGAGAIKVLKVEDGFVGFQNGIYWDEEINHSGSAIRRIVSEDGFLWRTAEEPFLRPTKGWQSTHVYALDVKQYEDHFYLYYNARNGYHFLAGREKVGLMTAKIK